MLLNPTSRDPWPSVTWLMCPECIGPVMSRGGSDVVGGSWLAVFRVSTTLNHDV